MPGGVAAFNLRLQHCDHSNGSHESLIPSNKYCPQRPALLTPGLQHQPHYHDTFDRPADIRHETVVQYSILPHLRLSRLFCRQQHDKKLWLESRGS